MLAKENRLKRASANRVFQEKKRENSPNFSLLFNFFAESETDSSPQITIIVGKKTAKTAVERNKIKRKIRHLLQVLPFAQLPRNFKGVLMALPGSKNLKIKELETEIQQIFTPFIQN